MRPAHAFTTATGFHVRVYTYDTQPWFIDTERSTLTSFDGARRPIEAAGLGMWRVDQALEVPFAAEDRASIETAPDRLLDRTANLDLALVSATGERAAVRITARVARIETRRG